MIVPDEAIPFLLRQRPELSPGPGLAARWEAGLRAEIAAFEQYLPAECAMMLDIGAGLGGIDILLAARWPDRFDPDGNLVTPAVEAWLLDGAARSADPRIATDPEVTKRLWDANRAWLHGYIAPEHAQSTRTPPVERYILDQGWVMTQPPGWRHETMAVQPYGLILSLDAWPKWLEPGEYLAYVLACLIPAGVLICDVADQFVPEMDAAFALQGIVQSESGWTRRAYRRTG